MIRTPPPSSSIIIIITHTPTQVNMEEEQRKQTEAYGEGTDGVGGAIEAQENHLNDSDVGGCFCCVLSFHIQHNRTR